MTTEGAIEREVQRRVAEILSSAGLGHGRITLEVLYMLPPEFTSAYTRLFDRALRESIGGNSSGNATGAAEKGTAKKSIRPNRTLGQVPGKGGRDKETGEYVPGTARSAQGGKRYRDHWVIKDEGAFRLKGSVDRKLKRIAQEIVTGIGKARAERRCGRCNTNVQPFLDIAGSSGVRFCPSCGSDLRQTLGG